MKFWTKTYFFVLILFLVVFNSSICWIMYTTYQSMISSEKEKALGEYYFIKQSLRSDMELLDSNNKLSTSSIINLMNYYSSYYGKQNTSFLFSGNNKEVIYSNLQCNMKTLKGDILDIKNGQNISLQSQNNNKYILISSSLDNSVTKYYLVYCYRLDKVMNTWSKLENDFVFFSFIISIILALLLALILNGRSKPLKKLIIYVNKIKDGNYNGKVEIKGKDEFALLGTNFNEMSEKIRATVEQLNSDMEMKQQFIDNLSHELRTPLTSIYGYAEYIQKAAISEEDKYEATEYIMQESKRLQYMAKRLLDMTIRRNYEVIKTEINVDELFEKVIKTVSANAKEKSISINASNSLSYINGEQQLIESILINLLDNAIKASSNGQSVEIVGLSINEEAVIQVIDKGRGISNEHISRIIEPFYRVDKARSKSEGGAGLGLTLCKQILDMHHGELEIISEVNKGTTVAITFTTS